jgi:epoxyqueuosine reductase QueG
MQKLNSALTEEIFGKVRGEGADLVGFAPVERFLGAPKDHQPTDILPSATGVIVGIIKQVDSVVDSLPDNRFSYTQQHHCLNRKLDNIGFNISRYLQQKGFDSVHIAVEGYYEIRPVLAYFSHRHAAKAAGLGDIGINNLLVTPQYGSRVRIISVITNAPLVPSPKLEKNPCKEWQNICKKACVESCPAKCIDTSGKLNKVNCRFYHYEELGSYLWENYIFSHDRANLACGMCVKACKGWG